MDSISWPIMSAINQVTVEFIMVYTVNLYVILPNMKPLHILFWIDEYQKIQKVVFMDP